jgi:thioredoxin reductase (NADPH)
MQRQAADAGAAFQRAEVSRLECSDRLWSVVTDDGNHLAKAVIVATGSRLKNLGVPGEERLRGRGVSHCASCDGPLYGGKIVGVVGGGDSALQEALTLAGFADQVWLFHDAEQLSAQQIYQKRVSENPKIVVRHRTVIEEILGDEAVSGARVRSLVSGESSQVDLSGLFVYIGLKPNTELLRAHVKLSDTGRVPTDGWMKTERDGLYAAGDIRQDSASQAVTSAGDGATAAIAASRYIRERFP